MGVYHHDPISGSLLPVAGTTEHLQDEMVANYEGSATATHAYQSGEQFIYADKLYIAKQAIAIGDTITPDVNCTESEDIVTQLADAGSNFLGTMIEWNAMSLDEKIRYKTADIYIDELEAALMFSSDASFTLEPYNRRWDGTIEYKQGNGSWQVWDGTQLSGDANNPIYLRGINNTVISNGYPGRFVFTGKYCTGNIETLLDYQTVQNGEHPIMGNQCFMFLFRNCTALEVAPTLSAIELVDNCYYGMFQNCTALINPPKISASIVAQECCHSMFSDCTNLTTLPQLFALELAQRCYAFMFFNCTSLKLSTTQDSEYQYAYRIPMSGTGIMATEAIKDMFWQTGISFIPDINVTYFTDHKPV